MGEAAQKETLAFDKVKVTREAMLESKKQTREAQVGLGDIEKRIAILELEAEARGKTKDLTDAKEQSSKAAEAAKKALEEAKAKEKPAAEAAKSAQSEIREKENEKSGNS